VKKCSRVGQTKNDNMAHAHCMLDTYGYKHTLTIGFHYNNDLWTHLSVTLYVHWLSCWAFGKAKLRSVATGHDAVSLGDWHESRDWHQMHSDATQCPRSIKTSKQDI